MKKFNYVFLATAAVFIVWGPLHEVVNWAIFNSYGVSSTIHIGLLSVNDCPWNCYASNFITPMWTQANSTQYYQLYSKNPNAWFAMSNELVLNEHIDSYLITSAMLISIFLIPIALMLWLDKRRKR